MTGIGPESVDGSGLSSTRGLVRFRFQPQRVYAECVGYDAEIERTAGIACCVDCLTPCVAVQSRAGRARPKTAGFALDRSAAA